MDMNLQSAALGMAGVIGSCVAVFHGILVQRLMVRPFEEFFSHGQADSRFGQKARAVAVAFQHDQLVPRRTRPNRRCKLVQAGRKARDWPIRWQPLLVWRSRQPLGDARSPSGLDAHGSCAHFDRLWCQQIQWLRTFVRFEVDREQSFKL